MSNERYVLGVSMSNHDRSAAVLRDGVVVAAIAEERIDRRKKSHGFYGNAPRDVVLPPMGAITYVVRQAGITLDDIELLVCGRSITTCREQLLAYVPISADRVVEPEPPAHHLAHAYSAYLTAPFPECDVLVLDEQGHHVDGRFERGTWFSGAAAALEAGPRYWGDEEVLSLGMFYDIAAAFCGLAEAALPAAGKLMALAGFGRHREDWPTLFELRADGDAVLTLPALDAFLQETVKLSTEPGYHDFTVAGVEDLRLKYQPAYWTDDVARDLATKAQQELERALLHIVRSRHAETGRPWLAYAGGVALNCTANARLRETGYRDVFVHPAATDDGAAVGLAAYGWIETLQQPRVRPRRFTTRLGKVYESAAVTSAVARYGLAAHTGPTDTDAVADLLAQGSIVCWFEGGSEWGPRALGARSILADVTVPGIVDRINATVKFREPFRPFGISVAEEDLDTLLDVTGVAPALAPYMLAVARPRTPVLNSVVHRDGTVRYQSVGTDQPAYHRLLLRMRQHVSHAVVLNTSFNTAGEPLVETPDDAVRQFLLSGADALYLQGTMVRRRDVPDETMSDALRTATRMSHIDPLRNALGVEAAGYPDAAAAAVRRLAVTRSWGPDMLRERAALLMRVSAATAPNDSAGHAVEVLRWSGLPGAAVQAAEVLADRADDAGEFLHPDAARLLALLGRRGASLVLDQVFNRTGHGRTP
jgi:carbamoyltransferase